MSGRAQRNEVKVGNFQNQSDKLHAEKIVEYCFSRIFPFTHCKVTCKACPPPGRDLAVSKDRLLLYETSRFMPSAPKASLWGVQALSSNLEVVKIKNLSPPARLPEKPQGIPVIFLENNSIDKQRCRAP